MRVISIIVPFYNEEKTLETLLKKVDKLRFPSLKKEIVCVNDGSFDRSEEILKRLMRRMEVKYIKNSKNSGKSQSVRRGVLSSKGDIVVFPPRLCKSFPKIKCLVVLDFPKLHQF